MHGEYMLGGVVPLVSYWRVAAPPMVAKIKGNTATVKAEEDRKGHLYLYINLPLIDGKYIKLRVWGWNLDEGDIVYIPSIVVLFIDTSDGKTIVRYDSVSLDEQTVKPSASFIRNFIVGESKELMDKQDKTEQKTIRKIPKDAVEAFKKAAYVRNPKRSRFKSSPDFIDATDYYEDPIIQHYSECEQDIIYGLYDGNVDPW